MNDTWCELQYDPNNNTIKKILPGEDVRASIARLDETVSQMNELTTQNNQLLSTPPSSPSDDEIEDKTDYHKNWECSKCHCIITDLLDTLNYNSCLKCGRYYEWDCCCSNIDYCYCDEPCNIFLDEYIQLEKEEQEMLDQFKQKRWQLKNKINKK